jgi:hypothetical protein
MLGSDVASNAPAQKVRKARVLRALRDTLVVAT